MSSGEEREIRQELRANDLTRRRLFAWHAHGGSGGADPLRCRRRRRQWIASHLYALFSEEKPEGAARRAARVASAATKKGLEEELYFALQRRHPHRSLEWLAPAVSASLRDWSRELWFTHRPHVPKRVQEPPQQTQPEKREPRRRRRRRVRSTDAPQDHHYTSSSLWRLLQDAARAGSPPLLPQPCPAERPQPAYVDPRWCPRAIRKRPTR
eukprot:TRINITY_DN5143_c0_g1_i1.p1 TRINITY_DN5143_c0_g1~~TRINITY_DN5143_c0_g1_i1.p1  ORF type:complete len:211 (+),score=20.40 TRINITY_DN5143_c0_g1_i1:469-1101(+)